MTAIHPAAHISPEAEIGRGIRIGPGAVVGENVRLGDDCEVGANAVISGPTLVGSGCRIHPGAVIGGEAQMAQPEGRGGRIEIGPGTVIRELATIHRSMYEEGATRLGAECYIMSAAHVAHDCLLGDRVILTNFIGLSGHVEVGNDAYIANQVGVHQFVRIGEGSYVVGPCGLRKDVGPYLLLAGHPPEITGLNIVGLRRKGVSAGVRGHIKRAYRILFHEAKTMDDGLRRIGDELPLGREIQTVIEFVRNSKRGIFLGKV